MSDVDRASTSRRGSGSAVGRAEGDNEGLDSKDKSNINKQEQDKNSSMEHFGRREEVDRSF